MLPLAAARSGARLLHCTSGSVPLFPSLPVVVTVHDVAWLRGTQTHAPPYARAYFGAFSASRWRRARRIIVDSSFTREELLASVDVDPEKVVVVYPGVDDAFASVRRTPATEPTLLCVGTVERRKNAAIIIEALASLPGAKMVCAGPPTPYQAECAQLAQRLGVADRVAFLGYVSQERLFELYARASLAVVPSRYEGFGYAAAQALCAGVPLVAARSSSLPEVAAEESLLSPDDPSQWSSAIANLLASRERSETVAARKRQDALARFSWRTAAAATAEVYRAAAAYTSG